MVEESEAQFLRRYDMRDFPPTAVTVDLAVFTIRNDRLVVLLVERGEHPFKGRWALPGGFTRADEGLDQAAARELRHETSLELDGYLEQLRTYGDPGRDPRGAVVTVAYVALVPHAGQAVAGDDAVRAHYFAVDDVLAPDFGLAFDHAQIIDDGLARVRAKLEYAPVAPKFLADDCFTISELRHVYEVVWGTRLPTSNFRRKVLSIPGFVVPVGSQGSPRLDGGRRSDLYRAGDLTVIQPPLRQPKDEG